MGTVNRVFIIGRLGAAPEGRTTPSGSRVCTLRVATDRPSRGQDGVTDWHRVVAWDRTAEQCEAYLDKGQLVAVEGAVQYSQWKSQDGQPRRSAEVRARVVHFLSQRVRGGEGGGVGGTPLARPNGRTGWQTGGQIGGGGATGARGSEPRPERPLVSGAALGRMGGSDDLPF